MPYVGCDADDNTVAQLLDLISHVDASELSDITFSKRNTTVSVYIVYIYTCSASTAMFNPSQQWREEHWLQLTVEGAIYFLLAGGGN